MASDKKKPWVKHVMIGVGVVAILLVEVGVAYMLNKRVVVPKYFSSTSTSFNLANTPPPNPETTNAAANDSTGEAMSDQVATGSQTPSPAELNENIFMISDMIINPAGSQGGRYVAMSVGFGVSDVETLKRLQNRDIQIRDAVIALLSQKTLGKFIAIEERAKLKQDILDLVNHTLNTNNVQSIYFTEYVIQ